MPPDPQALCEAFRRHLQGRPLSQNTVAFYLKAVRAYFRWSKAEGIDPVRASTADVARFSQLQRGRHPQRGGSKVAAVNHFHRWAVQAGIREANGRRCVDPTIDAFCAYFIGMGRSKRTARDYTFILSGFARSLAERGVSLTAPTTQDVSAYLAGRAGPLSPRALSTTLNAIRAYFVYLKLVGLRADDPTDGLKVRVPPLKPQRPYEENELRRLVAACATLQERALLMFLLGTGLRAGEATSIRVEDVDWELGRVCVHGKGGKYRYVVLSRSVLVALWKYASDRTGWLFPSRQVDRPISYPRVRQIIRELGVRAAVRDCRAHRFRTTYAVAFLRAGGDVGALRHTLGHSTLAMAIHYAQWTERDRALEWQQRIGESVTDRLADRSAPNDPAPAAVPNVPAEAVELVGRPNGRD